jgi:CheY-like chemotaxis protein
VIVTSDLASVLVADDNAGVRESVCEILRSVGYEVTEADDGDAALERYSERPSEVVVLDVRMPRLDGISVVENMVPAPPPPAIVLVSAYDLDQEARNRLGTRIFRFLRKPVSPPDLLNAVSEAAAAASSPN